MKTTRRRFFAVLTAGAVFILTPLRAFSKPRETQTVTAIVHQRVTETGARYLYIAPQVRGFRAGELVEVTIRKVNK